MDKVFKNKFDLTGKTALITGSAGLLGVEHCLALNNYGANVIMTDINIQKLKFEHNKNKMDKNISYFEMDVTKPPSIINLLDRLGQQGITIDILVNNAAIDPKVKGDENSLENSRLENFSLDDWNFQLSVGLTGAFLCSKYIGHSMVTAKKGGVILNISSDLSVISPDQRLYELSNRKEEDQPVKPITYSVIKSGLVGMTKYLATYWIKHGIRCNALSPGGVYNDQNENFLEKINHLIPMQRMASKFEYREAVVFLCSEASSYLNGHNLIMDGGRSVL